MAWDVEVTDEWSSWYRSLTRPQQDAVEARVDLLAAKGPSLKRPVVGAVKGSAFDPQMKELRVSTGGEDIRVLFMFDPRRIAILLVGGSKTGRWQEWYDEAIPEADELYRVYLQELEEEGEI